MAESSKFTNKISPLIEGQVPDFVQADHPVFVDFVRDYFKFLEAGRLTLDVTIDVPTNRRDFFGNTIYTQTSKKVASRKRIIKVKNFPEKGKPESFNGAVGNFDISLNSSKSQLKATESFQLEFKVNGNGNLKLKL